MDKELIITLSPEEGYELMRGNLSVLVRKKKPKYPIKANIYIKRDRNLQLLKGPALYTKSEIQVIAQGGLLSADDFLNGKVICKVLIDNVEEIIEDDNDYTNKTKTMNEPELLKASCLTEQALIDYLPFNILSADNEWITGYAIHVKPNSLEIFDKPKEIGEFVICREKKHKCRQKFKDYPCRKCVSMNLLTHAPSNYCYVEV